MLEVRLAGSATGPSSGQPVVLLHGFPFDRSLWEPIKDPLSQAGFRPIMPDLRGHGRSPSSPEAATMDIHARDVFRLLDRLQAAAPVLVGHSLGGYVALEMVAQQPDRFAGLVLCATRATADDAAGRAGRDELIQRVRKEGIQPVVDAMLPKVLSQASRNADPGLAERLRELMAATPIEGAVAALQGMRDRPDRLKELDAVRIPTLVVAGSDDPITPPGDAKAMARAIPGARLVVMEGCAHLPMVEAPAAFNRIVLSWLEETQD